VPCFLALSVLRATRARLCFQEITPSGFSIPVLPPSPSLSLITPPRRTFSSVPHSVFLIKSLTVTLVPTSGRDFLDFNFIRMTTSLSLLDFQRLRFFSSAALFQFPPDLLSIALVKVPSRFCGRCSIPCLFPQFGKRTVLSLEDPLSPCQLFFSPVWGGSLRNIFEPGLLFRPVAIVPPLAREIDVLPRPFLPFTLRSQ